MIIITGIRGFVGSNLNTYLCAKQKHILGASRNPGIGEVHYSEINKTLLDNVNCFVHLAGKAHDLKKSSEDYEYYEANTKLTQKLFNQFLKSTCEVFIYMSSIKAVSDVAHGIITEDVLPNPITSYGKSKLAAEEYILSKKIPENKRVYILRPCMIHGPKNKGNLNLLYNFISIGIPYPLGRYSNKRSFVSVYNLCFIIDELIDNPKIYSGIYNIADDISLSTTDLIRLISGVLRKPTRILKVPKIIIRFIAKVGDVIPLPINSERLLKLTENYEVSNLKIKKAIQKELPLTSKEGILKTLITFK